MAKKDIEDKKVEVKIAPLQLNTLKVKIVGKTPLLMDKMSDETKLGILAKQTGISKSNKKKVRFIEQETKDAIHITSDGQIGFPSVGFKKGMIECTSFVGDKFFSKKLVSSIMIVNSVEGLVPISYGKQSVVKHSIKGQTKFTPCFEEWGCELVIQYDSLNLTDMDVVTLLDYAGFYCGVGAWRPKGRDGGTGDYGMYEVKKQ